MDFFEAVNKRQSVRDYLDKEVPREFIEKIVDSGRRAATARNIQPWEFVAVTEKSKIIELADMVSPNGDFMRKARAAIVVFSQETKYYLEDCSAATENMLLAITALGLGACWIAGDKKDYALSVVDKFKAKGLKLVSVIAIGYPQNPLQPKTKKSLKEVIHWEKL